MSNKFVSIMEAVGRDFKRYIMPWAETAGEVAVMEIAPGLGPLFNHTVSVVKMAEANFASVGQQKGTGTQKAAAVTAIAGNLIKQGLDMAGMQSDEASVQKWITTVCDTLKAAPSNHSPSVS